MKKLKRAKTNMKMGKIFSYLTEPREIENTGNLNREYRCGGYFTPEYTIRQVRDTEAQTVSIEIDNSRNDL